MHVNPSSAYVKDANEGDKIGSIRKFVSINSFIREYMHCNTELALTSNIITSLMFIGNNRESNLIAYEELI
jgi:hypothetical protein